MSYSPMQLAEAFIQTGELTDALDALNQQMDAHPSDDHARRLRAAVLSRMPSEENQRRALDDLQNLRAPLPEDALLRATIHERLGAPTTALAIIMEAHQNAPTHERTTERYLHLLQKQKKFTQALDVLSPIIAEPDANWRWLQWAGDFATALEHYTDAIVHYSRALDALQARYGIVAGAPAAKIEDNEQITEQAALTVQGAIARLFTTRASCYECSGQFIDARRDYDMAQALIPDDTLIRLSRGILVAKMDDLKTAQALCQSALDDAPNDFRVQYLIPALRDSGIDGLQMLINITPTAI